MRRLWLVLLMIPSVALAQKLPEGGFGPGPRRFHADTALPPATRAYGIGVVGYTGGTWQPSGLEFALLWRLGHLPTAVGAQLTVGTFVQNQAVLFGTTRGFFTSLGLTVRQPLVDLASLGGEHSTTALKLELAGDLSGSANLDSPLPQGRWGAQAALLLGFAFGSADPLGQSVGLYFGPAALLGSRTTTLGEFAFRMRLPLGRR